MNIRIGIGASLLVVLAAAAFYFWTHRSVEQTHAAELKLVADNLFDPESVRWRGLVLATDGAVCGEVNAKNKIGGYVGFRKFYVYQGAYGIESMDEAFVTGRAVTEQEAEAMGMEAIAERLKQLEAAIAAGEGLLAHCQMLLK